MFLRIKGKSEREDAFKKLFYEMYPALVRFAVSLIDSYEDARDIVSEVMETVWNNYCDLDEASQKAWLYTSVRNSCLNFLKHQHVEQTNIDRLMEATYFDMKTNYVEHESLLRGVEEVVGNLPEPTKSILRCCYWEKKTYKQTAEEFGLSPDTIKKHISKAFNIIRNTFYERRKDGR